MKTIKIFLASSDELKTDRDAFGNLIRRLNKIYEKRGIHIDLFEWEDYDAAYNGQRKQDEYNEEIRASQIFLAMFHTKAGKFTIEEFNVATEEFKMHASPKIYTYCKDLQEGEQESEELIAFKKRLLDELGHYWCRYNNSDSLQLHFVLQLQLVENNQRDELKLEDGIISLGGMTIAHMDQLQFASGNEAYQKMSNELALLPEEIKKAEERMKKYPDDKDLVDEWQKKLDRYHELNKQFTQLQQALFATAKQISKIQLERTSAKLHRAIEAFEKGNLELANFILEEISHEADQHMAQLEQDRLLVHKDIDALLLQANTVLADTSINIEERIARVEGIYAKADDWAIKSDYDKEKHLELLFDYARFLNIYGKYDKALETIKRHIALCKTVSNEDLEYNYFLYNLVASIYSGMEQYDKALDFYHISLTIQEECYEDSDKLDIANTYNSIGIVYEKAGKLQQALQYFTKALDIQIKVLPENHHDIVTSYCLIGNILRAQGKPNEAIDFLLKASRNLSTKDDLPVDMYVNLGNCCFDQREYTKAIDYYQKALKKQIDEYGINDLAAGLYNDIGRVYIEIGEFDQALAFIQRAEEIIKTVNARSIIAAEVYNNLGNVYLNKKEYLTALECFKKAVYYIEKNGSSEHYLRAISSFNIGITYYFKEDYTNALKNYLTALPLIESLYGLNHIRTSDLYHNIGMAYHMLKDYPKALHYYEKALAIRKTLLGEDCPETQATLQNIDMISPALQHKKPSRNFFSRWFKK